MIGQSWYGHGKLLITGEYLIMEGAKGLALPLKLGQYLTIKKSKENGLLWTATKPDGLWFQVKFELPGLKIINTTDETLAQNLRNILRQTQSLNTSFLKSTEGINVETMIEFDTEFGFGSSSTLISNLASWSKVDPYQLLKKTFGGSGYDIACATSKTPIIYQLSAQIPVTTPIDYRPSFSDQLYFVYLGEKKSSAESIKKFKSKAVFNEHDIQHISSLTDELLTVQTIEEFEKVLNSHEKVMSKILDLPTVKDRCFSDYPGMVKSLGAWGGDFVLMTARIHKTDLKNYLTRKGFSTIYAYDELVIQQS